MYEVPFSVCPTCKTVCGQIEHLGRVVYVARCEDPEACEAASYERPEPVTADKWYGYDSED